MIGLFLAFALASSFFLGGNIRKWMLGHDLDLWERTGMILHPVVIGLGIANVLKGSLAD